jgi:hypothetical protein
VPSPERILHSLTEFLRAPTWSTSRQIVRANQGLINVWIEMIDVMLKDRTTILMIYPGRSLSEATALLKLHRAALLRCQQIGITTAFADVDKSHYIHGYFGASTLFLPAAAIIVQPLFPGYIRGRRRGFLIVVSMANALALSVFYIAAMNGALNGDRLMNATTQGLICYLGITFSIVAWIAAIRRRVY